MDKEYMEARLRELLFLLKTPYSPSYNKGILVGVVTGIMALKRWDWDKAVDFILPYFPEKIDENSLPDSWREEILNKISSQTSK